MCAPFRIPEGFSDGNIPREHIFPEIYRLLGCHTVWRIFPETGGLDLWHGNVRNRTCVDEG